MAIFKCKMCGGALEVMDGATTGECQYCGTMQTLPKLNDDKKANMYDRANHFRRNNEFDKARAIYEQILNEDNTDAESYWSIILCQYGIEYVEDPVTHKRVPTVNRAQFTSVFADENYKKAIEHADVYQKSIYEEEAKAIDEIQKGILAISQKEEPFDVFICYKETDNNGRRTVDSVIAQDMYKQLTEEGLKVFFSRITLEDKLGTAYEPYIFAALNSAKVMIVVGTKRDHFNAVWVKNEWSRYLALIREGKKKTLIPAYRGMNPYDLPDEFSHLQAQDMQKIGFMQDLIHGVKKIVGVKKNEETTVNSVGATSTVDSLLKRAYMFLEDGEWEDANEYCEKVLDIDPECAEAYLGKLMVEVKVKNIDFLSNLQFSFEKSKNYLKAIRFADDDLKKKLDDTLEAVRLRKENEKLESIYVKARNIMGNASNEKSYLDAAELFKTITNYKDSALLLEDCEQRIDETKKDKLLNEAKSLLGNKKIQKVESAIKLLELIPGWKDADDLLSACYIKIEELKREEDVLKYKKAEKIKKRKRNIKIVLPTICIVLVVALVFSFVIIPNTKYKSAIELVESGNIVEGYEALIALEGYKDSAEKAEDIYDKYSHSVLNSAEIGDIVTFGRYEQDNNLNNGEEPIEWQVLEIKDGKVLLITNRILEFRRYNDSFRNITWENCTIRQWLNNDFYKNAFSEINRKYILTSKVSADDNPYENKNNDPGNDTMDKIFLLSIVEAERYLPNKECFPTYYAIKEEKQLQKTYKWMLRTPAFRNSDISVVDENGDISQWTRHESTSVYDADIGVRPAIWIDLEKLR